MLIRSEILPPAELDREKIRACVHCGLCLTACPTYRVLGLEMDSPRGRIYQMKGVSDGAISPADPKFRVHMYRCLDCRACETACPSGVQYGPLVETARSMVPPASRREAVLRRLVLGGIFTRPRLVALAGALTRAYQQSGAQRTLRRTGLLRCLPMNLGRLEHLLPPLQGPVLQRSIPLFTPAIGEKRGTVAFFTGCVMDEFFRETNRATVRVLAANGFDVVTPRAQACCGALHLHSGARDLALGLARRNVEEFARLNADYIVNNAGGCGSTLKEYADLLASDPGYAHKTEQVTAKMRDVHELLAEVGLRPPKGRVEARVTLQHSCHLFHAQKVRTAPQDLIRQIPGVHYVPLQGADQCCGSAGIYNITNYDLSMSIMDRKLEDIKATGAEILATPNPGCMIQVAYGLREQGIPMEVVHPIDLLDRAYRNGAES